MMDGEPKQDRTMPIAPRSLKEIFLEALAIAPPERGGWLEQECGDDTQLRWQIELMLVAHDRPESLLDCVSLVECPLSETGTYAPARTEITVTEIGPYKILELIGEGGMGAVYLAQQTEPVRRVVALKVIKAGMDSRQVLARFEAERQALALMDHPNIAKVLDAGTTGPHPPLPSSAGGGRENQSPLSPWGRGLGEGSGRPYFVMELVKGVPITKFCDERKLAPRQRLELFLPVCHAIQHAHQKGIIHRDIKPSNVLVALYDGKPVPKVIDFGVAKAAGQPLTERTLVTGLGAVIGTPEYMSPEQAELNQLDIDTRSDIYSLGVLLYELLTGTTPLEHKRMKETGLLEALRIVREEEVPTLGTRLSTTEALPEIAARRGLEAAKLTRLVRGELEWIVMKALEKDRSRRYETANGLAVDIEHFLAGETVQAVPPSVGYRLRKFAHRNKKALASTALLSLVLFVLVGGVGWVLSDRASRQARTGFEVDQLLRRAETLYADNKLPEAVAEVQKASGVLGTTGGDESLRRRVQQRLSELETAVKLEEILIEMTEPPVRDRVYAEYARVFQEYGIDFEALSAEEAAARIANSNIKLDLVLALDRWATSLRSDPRRLDPARWQRLQAISRAADPDPWRLRYNAASETGDLPALQELADGADLVRLRTRVLAALGNSLRAAGNVEASVAFLRKVQKRYPADYSINSSLGWSLRSLTPPQWDEAIAFRRIAVAVRPRSFIANFYLGFSLEKVGKLDEAMAYYRTAVELDPDHAPAQFCLANILRVRGKHEEAIARYRKASDLLPTDPNPLNGLAWELATCTDSRHIDPAKAVALAKEVVELSLKQKDDRDEPGRDRVGNYLNTLGVAYYRAGQMKEALAALERSLELAKAGEKPDDSHYVCEDWFFLAMVNARLDRKDEGRKWFDQAVKWMEKNEPKNEELCRFRAEAAGVLELKERK
jgi:eukaryotic-like serine/threonine-protein kinase